LVAAEPAPISRAGEPANFTKKTKQGRNGINAKSSSVIEPCGVISVKCVGVDAVEVRIKLWLGQ
jgi:hypothetical protein